MSFCVAFRATSSLILLEKLQQIVQRNPAGSFQDFSLLLQDWLILSAVKNYLRIKQLSEQMKVLHVTETHLLVTIFTCLLFYISFHVYSPASRVWTSAALLWTGTNLERLDSNSQFLTFGKKILCYNFCKTLSSVTSRLSSSSRYLFLPQHVQLHVWHCAQKCHLTAVMRYLSDVIPRCSQHDGITYWPCPHYLMHESPVCDTDYKKIWTNPPPRDL